MPELPEVETVKRGIAPHFLSSPIRKVTLNRWDLRGGIPKGFDERISGSAATMVERRGKYILIALNNSRHIVLHLGMSGCLKIVMPDDIYTPAKHDHVIFHLQSGIDIIFEDPRRFGMLYDMPSATVQDAKPFGDMGPEPLSNHFSAEYLRDALGTKKSPIKTALLDQGLVAGLGNIYVCEALFRAHIHPARPSNTITADEAHLLYQAIIIVLNDAIAAGGSTLKDYRHADGQLGYFQHSFQVYGQENEACANQLCNGHVVRCVQAGRSTFYCNKCQI